LRPFWELVFTDFLRSTYVECPDPAVSGRDFLGASWSVR
jgi:hypothetical protein